MSGLSRADGADGADGVQLEVRVPGRALTHASLDQRVLVRAHFSLEPTERAGHLFPEAPVVGQVSRAALRFADVLARQGGGARLPALAFDRERHRVHDVSRPPRALHLSLDGELPPARLAPGVVRSTLLAASTAGQRDLLPEEDRQQEEARSESPEQPHVAHKVLSESAEEDKRADSESTRAAQRVKARLLQIKSFLFQRFFTFYAPAKVLF